MKVHPVTTRDNERGELRVTLTGEDVEVLEGLAERVEKLAQIEDVLDSKAVHSPFIMGSDMPHVTRDGLALLLSIVKGWEGEDAAGGGELIEVA